MTTTHSIAIRSAAGWAADQSAMEALYGVDGYYTTFELFTDGEARDLTAGDEAIDVVCYNDWPTGLSSQLDVTTNWTMNATPNSLTFRAADGHSHGGIPKAGFWFGTEEWLGRTLLVGGNSSPSFYGIEVTHKASNGSLSLEYGNLRFYHCIISNSGWPSRNPGSVYHYTEGCLVIGMATASELIGRSSGACVARNTTAVDCAAGFLLGYASNAANTYAENCVAYNCGTSYGLTSSLCKNNAASDGATTTPPGSNPYTSNVTSADFVDAANDDYHLASGSALNTAGTNLYSTFTADIDGDSMPSSGAWPIGFDYYVASGGAPTLTTLIASLVTQTTARLTVTATGL